MPDAYSVYIRYESSEYQLPQGEMRKFGERVKVKSSTSLADSVLL